MSSSPSYLVVALAEGVQYQNSAVSLRLLGSHKKKKRYFKPKYFYFPFLFSLPIFTWFCAETGETEMILW